MTTLTLAVEKSGDIRFDFGTIDWLYYVVVLAGIFAFLAIRKRSLSPATALVIMVVLAVVWALVFATVLPWLRQNL